MANVKDNASSKETRRKLIEAAGQVFAERGLHAATLQTITDRAGVNKAAVNYHFHDKFELYAAVVRYALSCGSVLQLREDVNVPPEDRLRMLILGVIKDIFDPSLPPWRGTIIGHELAQPTAALEAVMTDLIEPHTRFQRAIVREILGPRASQQLVSQMTMSIMAQSLFYMRSKEMLPRLFPEVVLDAGGVEKIAAHITDFSLAALRATRHQLTSGRRSR
jgi:AcrR family transcriptional regulator